MFINKSAIIKYTTTLSPHARLGHYDFEHVDLRPTIICFDISRGEMMISIRRRKASHSTSHADYRPPTISLFSRPPAAAARAAGTPLFSPWPRKACHAGDDSPIVCNSFSLLRLLIFPLVFPPSLFQYHFCAGARTAAYDVDEAFTKSAAISPTTAESIERGNTAGLLCEPSRKEGTDDYTCRLLLWLRPPSLLY